MQRVQFRVTQLLDPRKQKSDIALGQTYTGELSENGKEIYYTDKANCQWIFYVGETCQIVSKSDRGTGRTTYEKPRNMLHF